MELIKLGTELPRATMWGNERKYVKLGEELENRLLVTVGFTADVLLLPIFNDLMQIKLADKFYNSVRDMIDKRE